jgi:hypothetical protein
MLLQATKSEPSSLLRPIWVDLKNSYLWTLQDLTQMKTSSPLVTAALVLLLTVATVQGIRLDGETHAALTNHVLFNVSDWLAFGCFYVHIQQRLVSCRELLIVQSNFLAFCGYRNLGRKGHQWLHQLKRKRAFLKRKIEQDTGGLKTISMWITTGRGAISLATTDHISPCRKQNSFFFPPLDEYSSIDEADCCCFYSQHQRCYSFI